MKRSSLFIALAMATGSLGYSTPVSAAGNLPIKVKGIHLLSSPHLNSPLVEWDIASTVAAASIKDTAELSMFQYVPTGALRHPMPANCHPKSLEQDLLGFDGSELERVQYLQNYFSRCSRWLKREGPSGPLALLEMEKIKYDVFTNPKVHPIRLEFTNGESSQGFLALKTDQKPRPMIVVKCGLFCEGGNTSTTRTVLAHLFDESPFHVLVLGNHTGVNNIRSNQRLTFGGFYEGQEALSVGSWLRFDSPFSDRISDVHLLGISLGGNAALFASLYNDYNPTHTYSKVYDSVVAYCPAVNVKDTMDYLFADNLRGYITSWVTWGKVQKVYPTVPDFYREINPSRMPATENFPQLLAQTATKFLSRLNPRHFPHPFRNQPIDNVDEFWQRNNFVEYAQGIYTPTLVWASRDDVIVKNSINARQLAHTSNLQKGNLQVLNVDYGSHCAFSISYGWQATSSILRTYFLSHSQSYSEDIQHKRMSIDLAPPRLDASDVHVAQIWNAKPGKDYFELGYKTYSRFNNPDQCGYAGIYEDDDSCYETYQVQIPFTRLPMKVHVPNSQTEAETLTRWANSQLEIFGSSGRLIGTKENARFLQWYQE